MLLNFGQYLLPCRWVARAAATAKEFSAGAQLVHIWCTARGRHQLGASGSGRRGERRNLNRFNGLGTRSAVSGQRTGD